MSVMNLIRKLYQYHSLIQLRDVSDGFYRSFAEIGIKKKNDGVLQCAMPQESAGWTLLLLFIVPNQLHGELNRLGGLDVSPARLLLVVYPLAGCLDDGRDVLITCPSLHCLLEPHFLGNGESHLCLLELTLHLSGIRTFGNLFHRFILMRFRPQSNEVIFLLTFDGFITMPSFLFFRLALDELEEFFLLPEEVGVAEAMHGVVFELSEAVHIELNG